MPLGETTLYLTDDEILLVRRMLNQELLKDEKVANAITLLTTNQISMSNRLTKVERMAWIAIGAIGALITGLPAI